MCGLAGILRFDGQGVEELRLQRMQRHLLRRGPDGAGIDVVGPSGMAHTRLSVVDLMGGHQPMSIPAVGDQGALHLVFNGEIYNHRALRRQLEELGHRFTTSHCDTEVLLHGYREWGTELPKHLHGMYAFAVWDALRHTLLLVRDRAGKKPLYVYRDSQQVVYASLIGAILAGLPQRPSIDARALGHLLTFGYTRQDSLLEGISELPAGHWMLISRSGKITTDRYWQPPPLSRSSTRLGALEAADELLTEAVSRRLEADVPLGCFLSGGLDSSLIAAVAQRLMKKRRLATFSVSMPDSRYDEGPFAARVAEHIGAEHHALMAQPDVEADLQLLTATIGEPLADSSLLPTYWLSKATREHVVVALSGDGGDELFGGYDRYRALRLLRRHGWWLRFLPTDRLQGADLKSIRSRLARLATAARHDDQARQYLDMVRLFTPEQVGELSIQPVAMVDRPPEWKPEIDPAEAARRWDLFNYLPYDLLRKVDRASMAVALEVRCPMLDTAVCDFAGHVPLHVLAPGGRSKALLREVAAKYLPAEITRRKKMGFAIPLGSWFRGPLADMLRSRMLDTDDLSAIGCRRPAVERMIEEHHSATRDHTHRLFALLSLSLWLQWVKDPKPPAPPDAVSGTGFHPRQSFERPASG